jgi:hypothetical protein
MIKHLAVALPALLVACADEHYTNVQNPRAGQVEFDRDN